MGFGVGDVVVAPGCGVGRVVHVEEVELAGDSQKMYELFFEAIGLRLWVPYHSAEVDGIRPLIDSSRLDEMIEVIASTEAPQKRANWNQRRRRYDEMMASNEPLQMAALLGELASVKLRKPLSFSERKMFDKAYELILQELKVTCEQRDDVDELLKEALAAG